MVNSVSAPFLYNRKILLYKILSHCGGESCKAGFSYRHLTRRKLKLSKIDEIRAEMVKAMKNKDKDRKETLSMLLAALKNKAIDKRADLTPEEEFEVVKKEIKQTKETMDLAPADCTDIIDQCKARLAVLSEFAPEEMSEDAIRAVIQEVLTGLGIEKPTGKDKGKIMKELMPKVKGKADGSLVNKIVGEMLA